VNKKVLFAFFIAVKLETTGPEIPFFVPVSLDFIVLN